ncbi:YqhG family protein [Virgibacillus kekensis]|uniref:YqhG family protein n=1 Tax=Virgibacillus kekensis TaxID=202261 RepID=A0ABV9DLD1_9BACI
MAISNLNEFLESYFTAHNCDIIENNEGVLKIQLNEKMDRALMNRPFYWHYVKSMGNPGQPMQLTLITAPEKRDGKNEWIHFGSPRLQQILGHLRNHEKFTRLFEQVVANHNVPLFPWLVTNVKISYQGKQKRDEIISIGLHLVNGSMRIEMMDRLKEKSLQLAISDYCYTISPIIKLKSGFKRIEGVLDSYINNQSHDWAEESLKTMEEELKLVQHFYSGKEEDEEFKDDLRKEIEEVKMRYTPRITFEVINGGIFYLIDDGNN